ncbi:RTA1 like protein-domain-containing protein [Microdochium trichocladiopsis]|uniref:RTA1 like protein-domain-containing protein n=1 Tax=Microdochium trichocladiopsis TaxID=1682393 RepID=A0A9P8XVI6_9PEZI|nr:RTA1 like protein-domain-containing protein [Microdochium trichocladiopsis]KAH7020721.1 RTA1 like protein-domain-containing protein [Microdochium trichocladiopsis]
MVDHSAAAAPDAGAFDFKLYRYDLSLPAAIVAVAVFLILSLLHTWRIIRHRSLYFTAFTIGGYFQVVGYCGRIWSHFDNKALGGFIMQAILILVAPALYAASIYMILGRLIRAVHSERLSIIPLKWMTKIFVAGDIVSFFLQGGGGGIQAGGTLQLYDLGEKIIIVGLFVQIVIFGFFLVTTVTFHVRQRKASSRSASSGDFAVSDDSLTGTTIPWQRHLTVLYVVSTFIMIRSIFRVVEYLQGNQGYLISHELFLYIFDAVLMAIVMAIFLVFYVDDLDTGKRGAFGDKRTSGAELLSSRDSMGHEMASRAKTGREKQERESGAMIERA